MTPSYSRIIQTPVGRLLLKASPHGLQEVSRYTGSSSATSTAHQDNLPASHLLVRTAQQLQQYFEGTRKTFDIPLDLNGTDFQLQVWRALQAIPYGSTCAYRDIAQRIGRPRAVRAVGQANGRNPVCIIIPCHRVITANGESGGYSGGTVMKRQLLALECNPHLARSSV